LVHFGVHEVRVWYGEAQAFVATSAVLIQQALAAPSLDRTVRALDPPRREAIALNLLSCQCPFQLSPSCSPQRVLPYPRRRVSSPAVGAMHRPRPCSGVLRRVRPPRARRTRTPEARRVGRRGRWRDQKGMLPRRWHKNLLHFLSVYPLRASSCTAYSMYHCARRAHSVLT
jgi:hypothetical protein